MELMATCLDKLLKKTRRPIPEKILGKMAVAVSIKKFFYIIFVVSVQIFLFLTYGGDIFLYELSACFDS